MEFYTLKNGVRVVLVPMPGVASIATGVYVGAGSRFETDAQAGVSHFAEHLAFKGTAKFPTQKEVSYLEGLGAMQNAATSLDYTYYYCKIPADKWREGLEVAKELALYPKFPEADIPMERKIILEELKWSTDHPDDLIGDVMQKALYQSHPLGRPVIGEAKTIAAMTRSDLADYHTKHYVAGNLVVAIAGHIPDPAGVKRQIEEWFGHLPANDAPDFIPFENTQDSARVEMISKPSLQQTFIALAVPGVTITDPRRFALAILDSYLGQGFTSKLFQEIREKLGLCYTISTSDGKLADTGYWAVFAGLNSDSLPEAIPAILEEMKQVTKQPISEADLKETKEKLRGPLLFSMENPVHQMNFFAKQVLDRPQEVLDYDVLVDRLMGITAGEVQQVAQDLFKTSKLNLAVVGPTPDSQKAALAQLLVL